MYVVIFAGGRGTRLMEETKNVPKPMVKIGPYPIIEHLIYTYRKFKLNKFILLTGYKSQNFYTYFSQKKIFLLIIKIHKILRYLTILKNQKIKIKYILKVYIQGLIVIRKAGC